MMTYVVQCKIEDDDTGLETLVGEYLEAGANHGRKFFKRKKRSPDDDTVFMYYWDDRDGAEFCGWYFGEEVGGSQVWSRNEKRELLPPKTGWLVPWNGDVQPALTVDRKFAPEAEAPASSPAKAAGGKTAMTGRPAKAKPPAASNEDVIDLDDEAPAAVSGAESSPPAATDGPVDERVTQATESVTATEVEATHALDSVNAMMSADMSDDSLKIVEELLQSQHSSLQEAQKKLATDLVYAKRAAPKSLPALNALGNRLRSVQSGLAQETQKVKEMMAKRKEEADAEREKAKAEEQLMLAEQRDAKILEESLPEAIEVVTAAEDALEAAATAARPLASDQAEQITEKALATIREVETCTAKAMESIRLARAKMNQKVVAAKKFAPDAKKVATTEYQGLHEKLNALQKKLTPFQRTRKDHELRVESRKAMNEIAEKLGGIEAEVDKISKQLAEGSEQTEADLRSLEISFSPVTASLAGAMKIIEQKMLKAEGSLKSDLTQMEERGQASKTKLEELRLQLRNQLEQVQAQTILKQGSEKAEAAELSLQKAEEAEGPFLKGLELEGAEAADAITKLKEAARAAEGIVGAAKSFLKSKAADIKGIQKEEARCSALEQLTQIATRVEASLQKLSAFKSETAAREASILLRAVSKKVVEAEAAVQRAVAASTQLLAEDTEASQLREASAKTMEAEKEAALACAEARKALLGKQRESADMPQMAEELKSLQGRLATAQAELGKQRKVAVQGEKLWKGKLLLQEKGELMKEVEEGLTKAEGLTTPIGDERPSSENVMQMGTALDAVQEKLAGILSAVQPAVQNAHPTVKEAMQALLERATSAKEKLEEMKEATRELREKYQCEAIMQEVKAKFEKVDQAFQLVSEAEGPYLKGMEILPDDEATKALADSDAAATEVSKAISDVSAFMSEKTTEIKSFVENVSKAGLEEMAAQVSRKDEAKEKLDLFEKDTQDRKVVAFQQRAITKVSAAEDAVKAAGEASAPLSPDQVDGISAEAAQEIVAKLGDVAKEASEKVASAKEYLHERQRDKAVRIDTGELSKLMARVSTAESDLNKAKKTASDHEQRLVAKIVLQEASSRIQELESQVERANTEASPLVNENGRKFIVASMARLIAEGLSEHCGTALSKEELFKNIGGSEEGKITEAEFVAFLEKIPDMCSRPDLAFSSEQLSAVFQQTDVDKDGKLDPQEFGNLFRRHYKCVHEVALTDIFNVAESNPVEKLQVNDIVEALSEPALLEEMKVSRLEVQRVGGAKGWVTLQGNQGTTYLEPFTAFSSYTMGLDKAIADAQASSQAVQTFLTSKTADMRSCRDGPLAEARSELAKLKPKAGALRLKVEQLGKRVEEAKKEHAKREELERRKQEEKKDKKEASDVLKAIAEKLEKAQAVSKKVGEAAAPLTAAERANLPTVLTPLSIQKATDDAAGELAAAVAEAWESFKGHEDKTKGKTRGPWHEAAQEMAKLRRQLQECEKATSKASDEVRKACQELSALLLEKASGALRASLQERGVSALDAFKQLAGDAEEVPDEKLGQHLAELPGLGLSAEQSKLLLQRHGGSVGRRGFLALVERYAKCVREVTMTSDLAIKGSSTLRKAGVGEFMEVLEGPQSDSDNGVVRVRVRALSDEVKGWVSVKGNQGTAYLEDLKMRPCYMAVQAFALQNGFASEESAEVCTVKPGEVVEILDGPRREQLGNAKRAKVKAISDGAVGWLTLTSKSGRSSARRGQSTYTCKSGIALTDAMQIKECKVLRKLDRGEQLEVLEGPIDDPVANVTRIKAKARKDGAEGWVTTKGNAGSTYAEETGCSYVLEAEVPLEKDFATGSALVRAVGTGESVEVLEGPQDEVSKPVQRIHGRCSADGSEGWFTLQEEAVPWSGRYRCLKPVELGKGRELAAGEVLEVLEGPTRGAEGHLRVKCCAVSDGAVGWAAVTAGDGEKLLEAA